jgi:subtilisin-like proprotein convertase family protein
MFARHKTPAFRLIAGVVLCLLALGASEPISHVFASSNEKAGNTTLNSPQSQAQSEVATRLPGRPLTNRITQENALPGTDEWANIGNYDINALSAFPGTVSVNAGGPVNIHVKSSGSSLSARLYRLGFYQDHGARLYTTYSGISTPSQPNCTRVSSTGLVQCPWSPTFTINTDPNWISGLYLLRLDSNNGFRFFVYFTIRNDSYPADILVMEPTKTNQAYNRYGDESLYYSGNHEGRTRAYQVSFDRPYLGGAGTGGFFTHEHEMIRWLEASGYDVTYISDVDRAGNPGILLGHPVYLIMGHDEYWSWEERDAVEAAVASGVNTIFASGNESYWNIRVGNSSIGPNRIIICYKDADLDPDPDQSRQTITFRDLGRPENMLVGTGYQSYHDDALYNGPWQVSAPASSWYFDCTGLQPGVVVNNIVGEEWNAFLGSGGTPPGIEAMSDGVVIGNNGLPYKQNSTIYTAPSGAMVFAAGSIHWSWGLIDHSYPNQVFQSYALSNDADHRIEQLMANILDRFSGHWDGQPRQCGPPYGFYSVGNRPTRTPRPQPPTATGTPPTPTRTRTATNTPISSASATPSKTHTPISSMTATPSRTPTPLASATSTQTPPPQSATPVPTACQVSYVSTDVPKQIPDPGTVLSTLTVSGGSAISSIEVTGVTIAHTYASDLSVYLISPQGTRVSLFIHKCGNNVWTNANTGFTLSNGAATLLGSTCPPGQGSYRPEGSLTTLVGQQASGVWTLEVTDDGASDTGTLNGWGLRINYAGASCGTGTPASTNTPTSTPTRTPTRIATTAPTNTSTRSATPTRTSVSTAVSSSTATRSISTATRTSTGTQTSTATRTPTRTSTSTATRTATRTSTAISSVTSGPTNTPGSSCQAVYASLDVPKAIPDQGTTTSTLNIGDTGTIANIAVTGLKIAHTYSSDLRVFLINPQGTQVELFSHECGSNVWTSSNTGFALSNGAAALIGSTCPPNQGSYRPEESMAALLGQSAAGAWKLEVTDAGAFDTGTIQAWKLQITYTPGTCPASTPTPGVPEDQQPCTVAFADVPEGDTFYPYVHWMACRGYVSGYPCGNDGEPCPGTYFRPGASVTRGQLVKMVVNAAGGAFLSPETPTFADVPVGSAFYTYIETAANHGIIGGYPCGGAGEMCDELNRPYFRPGNNITRGQLSKVVAIARRMEIVTPTSPRFADVPLDHTFAGFIEAVSSEGIVGGYPCGSPGEPCDAQSRPYFRPANSATRGQVSKIVTRGYEGP